MKAPARLSSRVSFVFVVVLVIAVGFTLFLNGYKNIKTATTEADKRFKIASELLNNGISEALIIGDTYTASRLLSGICNELQALSCRLMDPQGKTLFVFPSNASPRAPYREFSHRLIYGGKSVGSLSFHYQGLIWSDLIQGEMLLVVVFMALLIGLSIILVRILISRPYRDLNRLVRLSSNQSLQSTIAELNDIKTPVYEIKSLVDNFKAKLVQVEENERRAKDQANLIAMGNLSAQVAHDIRSPLTALTMAAEGEELQKIPEGQRVIIRSAVMRIQDIANNLLSQHADSGAELTPEGERAHRHNEPSNQLLSSLIDNLASEKRLQFRSRLGITIHANVGTPSYGLFACIQPAEFKRVLSNLINNAVEAITESGEVQISLAKEADDVVLRVKDNGKGIPRDILPKLMQKGVTFDKADGLGLGLYHAKSSIESWGGTIEIQSEVGKGTVATIRLPKATPPDWFVPEIIIAPDTSVVILDDDLSIHQIWQKRLEEVAPEIKVFHFSTTKEINDWHRENRPKPGSTLFLVDYELIGETKTGLDVIEELGIAEESILVTSRYEEQRVIEGCLKLATNLIPKALATAIPISRTPINERPVDFVLIDDEKVVRLMWRDYAERHGKRLITLRASNHFFRIARTLSPDITIFIDSDLRNGIRGEKVAEKICAMGFTNIILATGHGPKEFKSMPWIKAVIDKRPSRLLHNDMQKPEERYRPSSAVATQLVIDPNA
jgi:signal transduction histidine kinase